MNNCFHQVLNRMKTLVPNKQNSKILIACSAGADSMFLTFVLKTLNYNVDVLHITHDMRPTSETDKDRDAVFALCNAIGVAVTHRHVYGKHMTGNIESNYRELRYQLFKQVATENSCNFVATGHNADDQLETILMNLSRGCGVKGLRGIAVSRNLDDSTDIKVIRPLIDLTKAKIYNQCHDYGIGYCEDITNQDDTMTRNNIRKNVLPVLKAMFPKCAEKSVKLGEKMASIKDDGE